jgi:lipopolysaccharide biosynthesis regulator YciM
MTPFLLLLLPIAAACGWYAAKRQVADEPFSDEKPFPRNYLVGLNYLLNEQPDRAVDVFIKMLEIDSETVETHLALGTLFRRRGEVGRAIRIHQNLIARPQLLKEQRTEALLALGQDYLRAGVLDRAERLFQEGINVENVQDSLLALRYLVDIYQQQKRWEAAIQVAEKLTAHGDAVQNRIAQYYCELAVAAHKQAKPEQAKAYIKQALAMDPNCVRASLLQGDIAMQAQHFAEAITAYQQIQQQDADYLTETVKPLTTCYKQLGNAAELEIFLYDQLQLQPRTAFMLALVELIQEREGVEAAIAYLFHELRRRPSLRGLQRLLALQMDKAQNGQRENLLILQDLVFSLLKAKPVYRCVCCGFGSKLLHWFCPSCKNWSTVKPVQGVEGE